MKSAKKSEGGFTYQETLRTKVRYDRKKYKTEKEAWKEKIGTTLKELVGNKLEEHLKQMEETVNKKLNDHKKAADEALKTQGEIVERSAKVQAEEKKSYADIAREFKDNIPKFTKHLKESAENITNYIEHKKDRERRQNNIVLHNVMESGAENPQVRKQHDMSQFGGYLGAARRPGEHSGRENM